MTAVAAENPAPGPARSRRTWITLLVDQGVVSAGNFLVGTILGRLLVPEEYGAYTLAFGTLNALNGIQGAIVNTPLTVFGASRDGMALRTYCGGTLAMQAILSLAMSLVSLAIAGVLAWMHPALFPAFLGLASLIGLDQAQEFIRTCLLSRLRASAVLANDVVYVVVRLGLIAALYVAYLRGLADPLTARKVLSCAAVGALVATAVGFAQLRSLVSAPLAGFSAALRENWNFGRWGLAATGTFAVTSQVAPWLLAALHGPAAIGALGACQVLVSASNPIMTVLANYWGPITARNFSRDGVPALRSALRHFYLHLFVAMGLFSGGLALGSRQILHFVYSGRYDGHALLLSLLALSAFLSNIQRPHRAALNAMRRPDVLLYVQLLGLALVAVVSWPAIRYFGLMGYAFQAIVAPLTMLVFRGRAIAQIQREEILRAALANESTGRKSESVKQD